MLEVQRRVAPAEQAAATEQPSTHGADTGTQFHDAGPFPPVGQAGAGGEGAPPPSASDLAFGGAEGDGGHQAPPPDGPGELSEDDVHAAAQRGIAGGGGPLPHGEAIQSAFGRHDVSGLTAHVGGTAAQASQDMGAVGYAYGSHVGFSQAPDLHTAAHEAAHVVQQRAGVQMKRVGEEGDEHERHADAVADAVVSGRSAEPLLDRYAGGTAGGGAPAVQRLWSRESMGTRIIRGETLRTGDNESMAGPAAKDPKIDAGYGRQFTDASKKTFLITQFRKELRGVIASPMRGYVSAELSAPTQLAKDNAALQNKTLDELKALIGDLQAMRRGLDQMEQLSRIECEQMRSNLETDGKELARANVPANQADEHKALLGKLTKDHLKGLNQQQLDDLQARVADFRLAAKLPATDHPQGLFGQIGKYEESLKTDAGGLLKAPKFVLDQVFSDKGASAGNLDVSVSEALVQSNQLKITLDGYIHRLREEAEAKRAAAFKKGITEADTEEYAKSLRLIAHLQDLKAELADDRQYMRKGMDAHRLDASLSLQEGIRQAREAAGASDQAKVVGAHGGAAPMSAPIENLGDAAPLEYMDARQMPGIDRLDAGRRAWITAAQPKPDRPQVSGLSLEGDLGNGAEGHVNKFGGKDDVRKTGKDGAPSELEFETQAAPFAPHSHAVKTADADARAGNNLIKEYAAYEHVGPHPNLPAVHGMATVKQGGTIRPGMVMDVVHGPTGEAAMAMLRKRVDKGELTPEQYWAAMQLIARRLVALTAHLAEKGITHNDIKPQNIMISESGEPVVIDLGVHTVAGETAPGWSYAYAPTQVYNEGRGGEGNAKTDLFMTGTTMLAGARGWQQGKQADADLAHRWTPSKGQSKAPGSLVAGKSANAGEGARDMAAEFTQLIDAVVGKGDGAAMQSAKASHEDMRNQPFLSAQLGEEADALKTLASLVAPPPAAPSWDVFQTRLPPRDASQEALRRQQVGAGQPAHAEQPQAAALQLPQPQPAAVPQPQPAAVQQPAQPDPSLASAATRARRAE